MEIFYCLLMSRFERFSLNLNVFKIILSMEGGLLVMIWIPLLTRILFHLAPPNKDGSSKC